MHRRRIAALILDRTEHDLAAKEKEIANRTAKLRTRLSAWRKLQPQLMPMVGDLIATQTRSEPAVHEEKLFIPSDLSAEQRLSLGGLDDLAAEEAKWREGEAFDLLRALQNCVKGITALRSGKQKNDRQQKANTRSVDQLREATRRRDGFMTGFNHAREAQISLTGSTRFPLLTEADLYLKPVLDKRRVGDSKLSDGSLWAALAPLEESEFAMEIDTGMCILHRRF